MIWTVKIWKPRGNFIGVLRVLWFLSVAYDVYTSARGNYIYVFERNVSGERIFLLVLLTLVVCGSSVAVSALLHED